jgi:hypothetical protein
MIEAYPSGSSRLPVSSTIKIADEQIRVTVHDRTGMPISGAVLELLTERRTETLCHTGADGAASFTAERLLPDSALMASAPLYATAFVDAAAISGNTLDVVLDRDGRISGTIVLSGGGPGMPGIWVTAIPDKVSYAKVRTDSQMMRCRHAYTVSTDEHGGFVVPGLREGQSYALEAGGHGMTAHTDRYRVFRATTSDVVLTMEVIYGAILQFTCRDDSVLERNFREPRSRIEHPGEFERFVQWQDSVGMTLAGHPDASDCNHCLLLLFRLTEPLPPTDCTINYEGTVPGFEQIQTSAELSPMSAGSFPVYTIELVPNAQGSGCIELELTGKCAGLASEKGVRAHLHLTCEHNAKVQDLEFQVAWTDSKRCIVVRNVPSGKYSWSVAVESGWINIAGSTGKSGKADGPFNLDDGGNVRLEVPLPDSGYIQVECFNSQGPCLGVVSIANGPVFTSGGPAKWMRTIAYRGTPLLIGPLPLGRYEIMLSSPRPTPEGAHSCEVKAGETSTEVFVLP